jgi:outer membrane receptor protein involved in Fe transport
LLASLATALLTAPATAQLQLGAIRGVVLDSSSNAVAGVTIDLTDPLGGVIDSRTSDDRGRFSFPNVAPASYAIRAQAANGEQLMQPVRVTDALPIDLTLRFPLRTVVAVQVAATVAPDSPAMRVSLAGRSIEQVPLRTVARGLQDVVATLPGWATEDNGLLHVRGIDDGFLYVIDGVPVYERLDQLSGVAPDASTFESITVMTGYIPAEFGYKAGGVIDVRSKSSAEQWEGTATYGQGTDAEMRGAMSGRGRAGKSLMVTFGGAAQQSDRFLDPVHPDNLHNHGHVAGLGGTITWTKSEATVISVNLGSGRSDFEVPNTEEQDEADQDQRQRIANDSGSITWQRAWSALSLTQVSAYARHTDARLQSSPRDTPLRPDADRSLIRVGAIASAARQVGAHTLKAGLEVQRLELKEAFQFAVTDPAAGAEAGFSDEALEFDEDDPFVFEGASTPTLWSAFVQGEWRARSTLTLSAGLRFDQSRLLLHRSQLSPRVGVSYRAAEGTVIRGSASRFFQPPQPENLLLSSSSEARELSPFADEGGGADLEPERQWAFEGGVNQQLGAWIRVDGALWYRSIAEVADPNVFAGTTIIFPNAVKRGEARGFDLRVELARRRSWSGYANLATGRVRQSGPITGGLFLEDDIEEIASGEEFIPDHDQPITASGGVTWMHERSGATISLVARHESGTPIERDEEEEAELVDRPGSELVDFSNGRVKARTIASIQAALPVWRHGRRSAVVQASVVNAFNASYAYNFGNPFSGTHFGAPRSASIAFRVRF